MKIRLNLLLTTALLAFPAPTLLAAPADSGTPPKQTPGTEKPAAPTENNKPGEEDAEEEIN